MFADFEQRKAMNMELTYSGVQCKLTIAGSGVLSTGTVVSSGSGVCQTRLDDFYLCSHECIGNAVR